MFDEHSFLERSLDRGRNEHAYGDQIGPGGNDDCDGIRSDICRFLELCAGNRRRGRVFGARSYRFFGRDRTQPAFTIAPWPWTSHVVRSHDATAQPKLADIGVTKTQSSRWQQLAALPKDEQERKRRPLKRGGRRPPHDPEEGRVTLQDYWMHTDVYSRDYRPGKSGGGV